MVYCQPNWSAGSLPVTVGSPVRSYTDPSEAVVEHDKGEKAVKHPSIKKQRRTSKNISGNM